MNLEATTQELKTQLLHGWLGSLALHGLLLLTVLPLFRLSPLTVPKEPFHWDVALVPSTHIAGETANTADATESVVSKPAERSPTPTRTVRTNHHAVPSAERIVPIEPQTVESLASTSQPSIVSSTASLSDVSTASIVETPTPGQSQASDSPLHQAEMPANSTTAGPSTPQAAAATANDSIAPPSEVAQPSLSSAAGSNTEPAATPRLDYGWLQQAIFRRLEELKRSSHPFLDQSQPLKVLVRAVVSHDGALLEAQVVKSSGLDRIDQEAMALVQRAFPVQLDRTLDRRQIAMRIPITYSRN